MVKSKGMGPVGKVEELLDEGAELCRLRGGALTPLRRRVLSLLLEAKRPVKAYDLLEKLKDERDAKPPTVYRTLDFLVEMGLVHRIESMQAFLACGQWKRHHASAFLICISCGSVSELDVRGSLENLRSEAEGFGFKSRSTVVEIRGICEACS